LRSEEEVRLWLYRMTDWVKTTLIQSWNDRLAAEVDGKAASSHTHTESDITDLEHNTDITGRTDLAAVPALDDEFVLYDTSGTANKKVSFQDLRRDITQDAAAAGTTQGAATAITGQFVKINSVTAASAEAAVLPTWGQGSNVVVENADGADTLKLFPPSGGTINGGVSNASIDVTAGNWAFCHSVDGTDWRVKVL
jgi:hypothetical protein